MVARDGDPSSMSSESVSKRWRGILARHGLWGGVPRLPTDQFGLLDPSHSPPLQRPDERPEVNERIRIPGPISRLSGFADAPVRLRTRCEPGMGPCFVEILRDDLASLKT